MPVHGVHSGLFRMLDRDYSFVTEHSATPASDGDTNTLRVKSYQELVNALITSSNKALRRDHPL